LNGQLVRQQAGIFMGFGGSPDLANLVCLHRGLDTILPSPSNPCAALVRVMDDLLAINTSVPLADPYPLSRDTLRPWSTAYFAGLSITLLPDQPAIVLPYLRELKRLSWTPPQSFHSICSLARFLTASFTRVIRLQHNPSFLGEAVIHTANHLASLGFPVTAIASARLSAIHKALSAQSLPPNRGAPPGGHLSLPTPFGFRGFWRMLICSLLRAFLHRVILRDATIQPVEIPRAAIARISFYRATS
jgi:hypothetical protein